MVSPWEAKSNINKVQIHIEWGHRIQNDWCIGAKKPRRSIQREHTELPKCYTANLPLSEAKKKDFILCVDGTIKEYDFYKNMKSTAGTQTHNDDVDDTVDSDREL